MDTDFLLIQKMHIGDENAFDIFVKKYYPQILTYCRIHISDPSYAEDLTQETFVRFFENLKQYHHYGKAGNFLYVIAANLCHDFYRKKREIPLEELPKEQDIYENSLEEWLDMKMALSSLPKEIRAVAILYFIQEQKQKDIAHILGITLSLVKYRINRARKLLSAYFGKEEL